MAEIYIVDTDFNNINSLSTWLRHKGYGVRAFSGSATLFEGLKIKLPEAILMDVVLKNEDGREVCKQIRKHHADKIPVILFSMAYHSIKQLKDSSADDFINKNATLNEITEMLEEHIMIENE